MPTVDIKDMADKLERIVEELKTSRAQASQLVLEKRKLEEKVASLEKHVHQGQKEGDRVNELSAQNREYKKKHTLLKSRVVSMLAKVDSLQ